MRYLLDLLLTDNQRETRELLAIVRNLKPFHLAKFVGDYHHGK